MDVRIFATSEKKLDCAIAITRRRQVECCIPTVGMDFVSVCFCILFKGSKHCEAELLAQNLHLLPFTYYDSLDIDAFGFPQCNGLLRFTQNINILSGSLRQN